MIILTVLQISFNKQQLIEKLQQVSWDLTQCHWLRSAAVSEILQSFETAGTTCPMTGCHFYKTYVTSNTIVTTSHYPAVLVLSKRILQFGKHK
jgi:hypothetical protein